MRTVKVGVFRHTLGIPSERFIPDQVRLLPVPAALISRDMPPEDLDLPSDSISRLGRRAVLRHMAGDGAPLAQVLEENSIDLLHAHFGVEGLMSLPAARQLGIPHVTTFHGFDATRTRGALATSRNLSWVRYAAGRSKLLRSTDAIICVSRHLESRLLEMGADRRKIHVIGTGVDPSTLGVTLPSELGRMVHVGRLVEKKGAKYLVAAMSTIVRRVPGAHLTIIGDGPLKDDLQRQIADLNLEQHVSLLGPQAHRDVLREIQAATVLILPSVTASDGDQEGLGQVLLEASALGRPVVATRHGGIVDAVLDGVTGALVPERDVAALAEATIRYLQDPDLCVKHGLAGRDHVERHFDSRQNATAVSRVYESVIPTSPRGSTLSIRMISRSTPAHGPGGMETQMLDLGEAWARSGHLVEIVTSPGGSSIDTPLEIRELSGVSGRYSRQWAKRAAALDSRNVDVIFGVSSAARHSLRRRQRRGPAIVMQAHGTSLEELRTKLSSRSPISILKAARNLGWLFVDAFDYPLYDMVIGVGPSVTRSLSSLPRFARPRRYRTIYNAVRAQSVPENQPRAGLLYAGRLHQEKGVDIAIRAAVLLGRTLTIAGAGPAEPSLRKLVESLDARSLVSFVGQVDRADLAGLVRASEFVLLPSRRREGLPMVALEALASRTPAVVSRNIRESFGHSPPDALFASDLSAEAFAETIRSLQHYRAPGLSGQFLLEECANSYISAFRAAISESQRSKR